jgi:hypothetical protein
MAWLRRGKRRQERIDELDLCGDPLFRPLIEQGGLAYRSRVADLDNRDHRLGYGGGGFYDGCVLRNSDRRF